MKQGEIKFWILFLFFNFLLFLPAYIVNFDTSTFFPWKFLEERLLYDKIKYLFKRENYDIFRVSIDLIIICFLPVILSKTLKIHNYVYYSFIYYFIALLFLIYYVVFQKIYIIEPILYNDIQLFGIGYLNLKESLVKNVLILIIIILIIYILFKIFKYFILSITSKIFGSFSKVIFVSVLFLFLINTIKSGTTYLPVHTFQETLFLIADNLSSSIRSYKKTKNLYIDRIENELNYKQFELSKKPDLYFIFIESYGKIVYEEEKIREEYERCTDSCYKQLNNLGWKVYSGFSIAPVSGGKSWLSFSTVMSGIKISDQAMFNYLFKNPDFLSYSHIFNYLKTQEYNNYRLNTMNFKNYEDIGWQKYLEFYGGKEWILYKDIPYQGRLYGFGPSPPDQYSINFAREYLKGKSPFSLFFITQNSHSPFFAPYISDNWKALNDSIIYDQPHQTFLKKPELDDYIKSICYELKILIDFVVTEPDSNVIFILYGDHQPPVLTGKNNSLETPIHIISKNKKFIEGFSLYGFQDGLKISSNSEPIKHEGFYSMFMRELLKHYGTQGKKLPDYYPDGIIKP